MVLIKTTNVIFLIVLCFALAVCHNPEFQDPAECPMNRTEVEYIAQGREIQLGNLSMYETRDTTPKRLLIAVIDIFGVSANTRMFSDLLGEAYGFRVVMPDFFRGNPWDWTIWPPAVPEYPIWLEEVASYENVVRYDIANILNHYHKTEGITKFGIFGFCWGAKIATLASTEYESLKVAGLVHPSNITTELISNSGAPTYLIPAFDDPDMLPFYKILKQKFGDNCGHRRFDDMCHGYATAMGNYSNPLLFQRVEHTIDILGNFFVRNLSNQ